LDIVPATASTYTAVASDVGSTLRVVATATNTVGSASAPSAVTGVVSSGATPPVNTSLPTIAGVPQQAQTLTASPGGWSGLPAPTFAYQWQRCNSAGSNCGDLPGATASTYTLGLADVGTTLRVVVTASNSSGTAAATSAVTAAVSAPPLGMPATPLLDDFNRPDNAGPPSASWSPLAIVNNPVGNNLRIVGQQVAAMTGATGDFWNAQQFGPDSEVWVTVTVKPTVDTDMVSLALRLSNPTLSTGQGYQAYFYNRSGLDEYRLYKRVAGSAVQLAFVAGPELQVGDRLLFRAVGTNLELWQGRGGSWTKLLSATDSTYTGAGYLGLSGKNTVVRLDNFGGGTLP
jgi:hypothetical protein